MLCIWQQDFQTVLRRFVTVLLQPFILWNINTFLMQSFTYYCIKCVSYFCRHLSDLWEVCRTSAIFCIYYFVNVSPADLLSSLFLITILSFHVNPYMLENCIVYSMCWLPDIFLKDNVIIPVMQNKYGQLFMWIL